jgi:hypothetical protein
MGKNGCFMWFGNKIGWFSGENWVVLFKIELSLWWIMVKLELVSGVCNWKSISWSGGWYRVLPLS